MIRLVRATLLGGALLGCRSRGTHDAFLAARVPVAHLDSVLRAADSVRLPLADARSLFAVVRAVAFGARLPRDTMTLAEIVTWGRAEQARQERADAEATQLAVAERARHEQFRLRLDSVLSVTVVSKTFLPSNYEAERFEDYISLTFAYQNKGTKTIRAFQGDVLFLAASGDTIYSAQLKVDEPLGPGRMRRQPGRTIKYNQFRPDHQRLRDTELSGITVVWQPSDIIFADGTRLSFMAKP